MPKKINVLQRAAELRQHADRLNALIENAHGRDAEPSDRGYAEELERTQRLLRAIADRLEESTLDPFLLQVRNAAQIQTLLLCDEMPFPTSEQFRRLAAAGLDAASFPYAKAALLALDAAEKENA